MTSIEERAAAALSVLGGRPVTEVARDHAVEPELVQRWADLYAEGGLARLSGRMDLSSFEARDRFLVLIAHEFRTPLTIIGGWIETMIGTPLPPDVERQALAVIRTQVSHLERVARDALDAGAVARGQLRLVVGPVRLRRLITAVIASLRDAHFVLAAGAELEVIGDGSRLEQVVGGVLEHARRIAGVAAVTIDIGDGVPDRVTVEVGIEGRELSFDEASSLFEPYSRADASFGTGLGLFLSRALVVAHDGGIGIRSGDGSTTLWFRLLRSGPGPGPLVERT